MANKIQCHLVTTAFQWSIIAALVLCVFASGARAQPAKAGAASAITGVYNGTYGSAQGEVKFKLSITQQDDGKLVGVFTLYRPDGSDTKEYTCDLAGSIHANGTFLLASGKWKTPPPRGFEMAAGLNGRFDPAGGNGAGQIAGSIRDGSRPRFEAIRDADESAKMANSAGDKKEAGAPATPVAPPGRRPAAAQAAAALPAELTAIDGVYHGSYTAADKASVKLKLTLTTQQDGTLAGVVSLEQSEGSATTTYTCRMDGRYMPGRGFGLARPKWETAAPKSLNLLVMNGAFDAAGGQGAGKISGKLLPSNTEYELTRDAAESAKMPTVIASKQAERAFSPTVINGVYTGQYRGNDGWVKLKFSIKSTDDGSLTGLFTHELPNKPGSFITYKLTGKYDAKAMEHGAGSSPFQFTSIEPVGTAAQDALNASKAKAVRVGITDPGSINGSVTGSNGGSGEFSCGGFDARKDATASADLDKVMIAQASAGSSAAIPVIRRDFDGVYNGSYADEKGRTNKFKLTLWVQFENKTPDGKLLNAEIGGLLTVFVTDASGTTPYTTEVKGFYGGENHIIQVTARGWEPPPSGVTLIAGLEGKFDPRGGKDAPRIYSPKFAAIRDATESANMDVERLRNHVYPGIVGVFNGTYTRENEPPTKFKLSITHNGDGPMGLAGMATIYLPVGSGTKPYTYNLRGVETYTRTFELGAGDWVTIPPKDFKNLRGMGFNGKVVLNETLTSARIISVPPPPSSTSDYLPQFEATYDAKESADINGAIAAQKAVGDAEEAAALKAREETIKNALPKQLASKDLVRKSRKYWEGFHNDMIREVFDGGFGAAIDEDAQFKIVFCTYVETFSAKYPDALPPNHQSVTVTQKNNRKFDQNGNLVNEDTRTFTIEMDPRFVEPYERFSKTLSLPGTGLRGFLAAAQPDGAQSIVRDLLTVATDMQKFFADHGGKSAAMRQMNENFLRAIKGEPSLQQAGGKIDGAEAESDKDLPPGRYARLMDAVNAYYRERADRDPARFGHSSSHDTAFCQRLAELCQADMSPEEEYYYANDLEGRFLQIMGSRANCPDPAWPRLHPEVEKAIEEVK